MPIRIYSSLSRSKSELETCEPGLVRMYVCGPTVYDSAHLGHARSAITFDVVRRYLEHRGFEVRFARNITDVDDKIIERARRDGRPWREIAEHYTAEYRQDLADLGLLEPTIEPRATDTIAEMQRMISALIERGHAYAAGGDVYFSVSSFQGYGKLSNQDLDQIRSGSRFEVDERKRAPEDFALWKGAKEGEPCWDSPWGPGRPGWHIECSAMACTHLGPTLDIHGGGSDLIFPHHENEIAQSEAASGQVFARHWMHNGMIRVNQEKMAKSLGNFFTIRALLDANDPETIRHFVVATHYRSPIEFSLEALEESRRALSRGYVTLARVQDLDDPGAGEALPELGRELDAVEAAFHEAMDDDFNTARALAAIFDAVRALNRHLDAAGKKKPKAELARAAREAARRIVTLGGVLGLFGTAPREWLARDRARRLEALGLTVEQVEARIAERVAARAGKDWAAADRIREALAAEGIVLEDRPGGTTEWSVADDAPIEDVPDDGAA